MVLVLVLARICSCTSFNAYGFFMQPESEAGEGPNGCRLPFWNMIVIPYACYENLLYYTYSMCRVHWPHFPCPLFPLSLRWGLTIVPRLASSSWAQEILLAQPPKKLDYRHIPLHLAWRCFLIIWCDIDETKCCCQLPAPLRLQGIHIRP